jgi:hypothetical protein
MRKDARRKKADARKAKESRAFRRQLVASDRKIYLSGTDTLSNEERVRWLLRFLAGSPLAERTRIERAGLWFGAGQFATDSSGMYLEADDDPGPTFTITKLEKLRERLQLAIAGLERGDACDFTGMPATWRLQVVDGTVRKQFGGKDDQLFLAQAADLLIQYWPRLLKCKKCETRFLPGKGQEFCTPACGNKERWQRFSERHPRRTRDYPKEYKDRTRRELGRKEPTILKPPVANG